MAETIHFDEKFRSALAKYFAYKSVTEDLYNHNIDAEFSGSDTVHISEIAVSDWNNYQKSQDPSKGSRFGDAKEVADYKYTFRLSQDVSFDRTVDRGNNDAQQFIKKAGAVMKAYTDKVIRPNKDKYRLKKWVEEAGIHKELSAAPTKSTILETIMSLHSDMIDENVPADAGVLLIRRDVYINAKLADQVVKIENVAEKSVIKGAVGTLDGLAVKPVSARILPANVYFMIIVKDAAIAPEKINLFRGIRDSENMDGDRIQFRLKFDAFVMPSQCAGVAVACANNTVAAAPTVTVASGKATLATTTTGGTIYYTLDGSDPRYKSADAKVYSAPVDVAAGDTVRCCAKKDGMFTSAVTSSTVTA